MAALTFYPVHAGYRIVHARPVIDLYGRTADRKQVCVAVEGFSPYFYVQPRHGHQEKLIEEIRSLVVKERDREVRAAHVEKVELLAGTKKEPFLKVYAQLPPDIRLFRKELQGNKNIKEMFDADIPYVRRFFIDKDIVPLRPLKVEGEQAGSPHKVPLVLTKPEGISGQEASEYAKVKALALDIETYNPEGETIAPDRFPILMAGFAGERFRRVVTWKKFKTAQKDIEFVEDEKALLRRIVEIVEEQEPDILVGYYSDGFDLPYLKARAEHLHVALPLGLDRSGIRVSQGRETISRIGGIAHLDIFKFIRKTMFSVLKTNEYTLDAVSRELLGEGKAEVDVAGLAEAWDKHPDQLEKFCLYNLKDAELTYRLYRELFDNVLELVKVVGQGIPLVSRMAYSQLVEWYLIKQAHIKGRVVPLSPHGDEIGKRMRQTFQGAFVVKPEPGLHKDIIVVDFRSLYPSIISAHNISPETLRCGCCAEALVPGDEKTWFCKKEKGFVSDVIEGLITRRIRIKEFLAKATKAEKKVLYARQYALKTVANSMYGYLGFAAGRWYSLEAAKSITAYGRYYINDVISRAQSAGFVVLYGDTDSVFLSLRGKSRSQAEAFIKEVNGKLPGLMELEFQGYYPRGIFVSTKGADESEGAKKKYALLSEGGDIIIKGFESVKRNYADIAREVQENVLDIILREEDIEKAVAYIRKSVKDLREHKIALAKVVLMTRLLKPLRSYQSIGPHVAAAFRLQERGRPVAPGTLVKYVVVEGKGKIGERVRLPDEVKQGEYDAEYYIAHQVIPVVEKIFEVLGYPKERLTDENVQSTLGRYS